MMENSIDAKSTSISVDIHKGGFAKIEIIDNGSGIDVSYSYLKMKKSMMTLNYYAKNMQRVKFRQQTI